MNIKSSLNKVTAIFLACLLIFVGISNLLSENNKEEVVAKVGKEVILLNEYKSLYQNYSNNTGSSELQKKLKYNLLNALIEKKLLLNLTSDLGLEVGEESIKDHIKNIQEFQNDKGEFDKDKFHNILSNLNITEKEYVSKLKRILPVIMVMTSMFKDNYPITFSEKVDQQIYKSRYQTRIVDIIKITKDAVVNIPEPDNQSLLDLYEKNKSSFHYPEYRTAQYISIDLKYFEDQVKTSDEEIDNIIKQQALKEQRDIFNLIFSTKEKAEEAKKALIEDKVNFEQLASETKLEDIKINNITKDFLPEGMRGEVFALKEGEVSEVLASNFGWHIIKIERVHQISDEDLMNLKEDIRSVLINEKSFEKINDFINQANYKIYNGATIEEISSEYDLPIKTIGPVDTNGKYQDGNQVQDSSDLISFIFSREKEQKSYFKNVNNTIVSVKIIDTIPSKLQSFEESKLSVVELWNNKFIAEKLLEIGFKIINQLKEKIDIEEIQGIELTKEQQLHRNEINQQNYPLSFVEEIFNIKTIGSVTNPIKHNNEIIIGILKKIHSSDGKLNTLDVGKHIMISLREQLINYLKTVYKVEVNNSILDNM